MTDDYQRIAEAIRFLKTSAVAQPSLDVVAQHIGLSPYHFQRLFKRFAGVSPKRFLQYLTSEKAKKLLQQSTPVLETSFAVGLSGSGRLHDLLITVDAMTPGEYKSGGVGLTIDFALHSTPFGNCLIAITQRGICQLEFDDSETGATARKHLVTHWPHAQIRENSKATKKVIEQIFFTPQTVQNEPLPLLLRGTNFQIKVWQALLKIPPGCVTSYGYLAEKIGQPTASRAVGTAISHNPIGYLIPCHRVLRSDGEIGGYRWGIQRKMAILGQEFCTHA